MTTTELLTVYDENLREVGVAPRSDVHSKGLLHAVVHCWLVSRADNDVWLYFQQRSHSKRDFPGWYDIASAGHVDAGESAEAAVIRETAEELGVTINPKELEYIGTYKEEFTFGSYLDNEICRVYLYPVSGEEFDLGDEVEQMVKVSLDEYARWFAEPLTPMMARSQSDGSMTFINMNHVFPHDRDYLASILDYIRLRLSPTATGPYR